MQGLPLRNRDRAIRFRGEPFVIADRAFEAVQAKERLVVGPGLSLQECLEPLLFERQEQPPVPKEDLGIWGLQATFYGLQRGLAHAQQQLAGLLTLLVAFGPELLEKVRGIARCFRKLALQVVIDLPGRDIQLIEAFEPLDSLREDLAPETHGCKKRTAKVW